MKRHASVGRGSEARRRLRLEVTGAVQGVGFRPFIHRLAVAEGLGGFVRNTGEGAALEVEGPPPAVERFLRRLDAEIRPPAGIHDRRASWLPPDGNRAFVIAPSIVGGERPAVVLPDLATCADCLVEILDPQNRRYRYPFTTCIHCGPRYSIIEAIPYDRARTVMRHFPMCAACRSEYDDPRSRRFHAETNACPACGPRLALLDAGGNACATGDRSLVAAAAALRGGKVVAVMGLGGFQLFVDARDEAAVRRLRDRKRRPAKPFAIMVSTIAEVREITDVTIEEQRLLSSAAAPIVLLRGRADAAVISPGVAPSTPRLGVMLPATPLHHLLGRELGFPVVATSGNQGTEPIIADEAKALGKLDGIADLFLVHDRPILRPIDDSVVRVVAGREMVLRHARGYAPQPFIAPGSPAVPSLALGAHQKNAVAIATGSDIVLGPHIGDLDGAETRVALAEAVEGLTTLYGLHPRSVACDAHPDYHSTRLAERLASERLGPPVIRVPHHLAHVLSCMNENGLDGPVLGVAWDGTGHGRDGTVWGGEFLAVGDARWRRAAHLARFLLPGGEAAGREPRRAALGALHAVFGEAAMAMADLPAVAAFAPAERPVLARMLARGLNAPATSSVGRLFDAVAAVLDLCQKASFEGEAAMAVEFAAEQATAAEPLPPIIVSDGVGPLIADWRPMLAAMVEARRGGVSAESLAASFHDALAEAIVVVARRVGIGRVVLTGGCFQNGRLAEAAIDRLRVAGFQPHWHQRVPPNDGGLALGQAAFACRPLIEEEG
ncbi:MAG: carbamoyltransferase HypF [Xanthobacteraceae bacterium]